MDCRACGGDGWLPSRSDDGLHPDCPYCKGTGNNLNWDELMLDRSRETATKIQALLDKED